MGVGKIMGDLSQGKQVLESNVSLPLLIDIIEEVHKDCRSTANFIRPHMIGGCFRASVFHLQGRGTVPSRMNSRIRRVLDNGSAVHSVVQRYLSESKDFFFAKEVPAFGYVGSVLVKGTCDGVLVRRNDKFCVCIEIKTINHAEWSKLSGAKEVHNQQALLYAYLLKIQWVKILYWDKDKQGLKEYGVQCTREAMKPILYRIGLIGDAVTSGGMPPFRKEECDPLFCQYYTHCPEVGGI